MGGQLPAPVSSGGTTPPTISGTNAQLIAQAESLYNDAQAKLRAGDLAGYQKDVDQIGQILSRLKSGSPSPSPQP